MFAFDSNQNYLNLKKILYETKVLNKNKLHYLSHVRSHFRYEHANIEL